MGPAIHGERTVRGLVPGALAAAGAAALVTALLPKPGLSAVEAGLLTALVAALAAAGWLLVRVRRLAAELAARPAPAPSQPAPAARAAHAGPSAEAEAERLEMVARLTGGVAHDFNNLLTVLSGNLELLGRRIADERQGRLVQAGLKAVRQGQQLTQQMLAFSRRQALQPAPFDLAGRLPEFAELLRRVLGGEIAVESAGEDGLWPVRVDAAQLELALIGAAMHARKAMPGGGTLRIAAANLRLEPPHGKGISGDFVALSLHDTGEGLPPEALAHAFEPFHPAGHGAAGFGLGAVDGFARQSGGLAEIANLPGRGTVLTLYLPRSAEPPPRPAAAPSPAPAELPVLVVEDNDDVAAVVETLLEGCGYRSRRVADAPSALALLARDDRFALVFSDVMMPGGMTGFELADAIAIRHPHLPVLLTTGFGGPDAAALSARYAILPKPYSTDALADALARCRGAAGDTERAQRL